MGKGWLLVVIMAFTVGSHSHSYSQCNLAFEYSVENSNGRGIIYLKKKSGNGPIIFRLYDVMDGKDEFTKTIEFKSFGNRTQIVFEDLKPSTYFIQAENKECKISIGDLGGIVVSNDNQ